MPYYRREGELPPTKHTAFVTAAGEPCFEEFVGDHGFSGSGSLLYHLRVPSNLVSTREWDVLAADATPNRPLTARHFRSPALFEDSKTGRDVVRDRRVLLANEDVRISYVVADQPSPLYSNGAGDEVIYIEQGAARLDSMVGSIEVGQGDIVVVPRVLIHRWTPLQTDDRPLRALCLEASGHVTSPSKHLSRYGQFLEGAPITERDLRGPTGSTLVGGDELDRDTEVYIRHGRNPELSGSVVTYDHHPFDVVGWDGYLYPYAINYRNFLPVTGVVVQPPPTYQLLEGDNFVVCLFVPRQLEYHPGAIKVPYYHANVDCDEVMFYYAGETAARKGTGIGNASVSLHPAAYTHGPTREAYLGSVGATESKEMAFMIDTFRPLAIAEGGRACLEPDYAWTWAGRGGPNGSPDGGTV